MYYTDHGMSHLLQPSLNHFRVLAGIFTNLSAGYIGLVLITPLPGATAFTVLKNLILAIAFYLFAVKLEEVTRL